MRAWSGRRIESGLRADVLAGRGLEQIKLVLEEEEELGGDGLQDGEDHGLAEVIGRARHVER